MNLSVKYLFLLTFCWCFGQPCMLTFAADITSNPSVDNISNNVFTKESNAPRFSATFKETDIREFSAIASRILKKTIILNPQVKGIISVQSFEPLDADQYYAFFLNVLDTYGFSVVPAGKDTLNIVPTIGNEHSALLNVENNQGNSELIMRMVRMKNLSGATLASLLDKINGENNVGRVRYYQPGNIIFITGRPDDVKGIEKIIKTVDASNDLDDIEVIPIKHIKASEMAKMLSDAYRNNVGDNIGTPNIVGNDTAQVVIINGNDSVRNHVKNLIENMDQDHSFGNSHVFFLKYADAQQMANLFSGNNQNNDLDEDTSTSLSTSNSNTKNIKESTLHTSSSYGSAINDSKSILDNVSVRADVANNALVVTGTQDKIQELKTIINKLDVRRDQVLVEAIVVEVQDAEGLNLGLSWGNRSYGGTNFESINTGAAFGESTPIVSALKNSQGIIAGFYHGNWGALFNALESNQKNNILATPSIVTLNNQQADFNVGQDVPILTGSQTTNSDNIFNTVERRTVGIKFKILPKINDEDTIQLKISQEISSLADSSNINSSLGSVFNIRTVNNMVQVENGETVVIGGLLDNEQKSEVTKVPLLGDIPWIGGLFRYTTHSNTKRNLMLFIRPHIIHYQSNFTDLTQRRYNDFRDDQQSENPVLTEALDNQLSPRNDLMSLVASIRRFSEGITP